MKTNFFRNAMKDAVLPLLGRGSGGGRHCLLLLLFLCPFTLAAQNITISNVSAALGTEGSPTTLTFDVRWEPLANKMWSDTVWVFVDYNNKGAMTRLPLSGATLSNPSWDGAEVRAVDGNPNGVWVVGNARAETGSFSATVQLHTATANLHGACIYAINYPPLGEYTGVNMLKFTGTPPFYLTFADNSHDTLVWQPAPHTYTYTFNPDNRVTAFTDASRAPGVFTFLTCPAVDAGQISAALQAPACPVVSAGQISAALQAPACPVVSAGQISAVIEK
jgi:hypothetical protein